MLALEQFVKGKSVALVGSALSLQNEDRGQQIDSHDVVIRMNLSIPGVQPGKYVGIKTDVWAIAKDFQYVRTPPGVEHIVFMKLTAMGDRDWPVVQKQRTVSTTRWPRDLEAEVKEFVGADPGTGIRLLYWLKRIAKPASIATFGMDCWDSPSCWSGPPARAHNPELEKAAMNTLLTENA